MPKIKWILAFSILFLPMTTLAFLPPPPQITKNSTCPIPKQAGNKEFLAQFFEDYILSIVFGGRADGTYVDVGAASPTEDSVTAYFYARGWHGINIEPLPTYYQQLITARPRDINVNAGISDKATNNLNFYRIFSKREKSDVLSTLDKNVLNKAIKDGYSYETLSIKVKTLDDVLSANNIHDITFLKIDVEGTEKDVLKSINLKKYRPQVIVIEALDPRSTIDSSSKWENILTDNNYVFTTFDGLNSYYVAKEAYPKLYDNFLIAYNCAVEANIKYRVLITSKMIFSLDFSDAKVKFIF
jgi:FkbM family methyltransferase